MSIDYYYSWFPSYVVIMRGTYVYVYVRIFVRKNCQSLYYAGEMKMGSTAKNMAADRLILSLPSPRAV